MALLPLVLPWNEFYWKSGEDGRLRIQECTSCSGLIHPPKPICPSCRSTDLAVREVSGRGILFGLTLNHHYLFPVVCYPYPIAQVSIEEVM